MEKKAIVLASFGAADAVSRKIYLEALTALTQESFPKYRVWHAFTSQMIIKKLRGQGVSVFSLPELLAKLAAEKYETVMIQPTHLNAGEEYEKKVLQPAAVYENRFPRFAVGKPAIVADENAKEVLKILLAQAGALESDEELLLMGHGSPSKHYPLYEKMQAIGDGFCAAVTIGVLEETDYPNFSDVLCRLQRKGRRGVCLMPLLLAAGTHILRDMDGAQETSWKNQLEKNGYRVRVYRDGLGVNPAFQKIYLERIRKMAGEFLHISANKEDGYSFL